MKYYILPIFLIIGALTAKAQLTPDSEAKKNYQILATRFSTTTSFEGLADAEHRLLVAIKNDADNQATWLLPFNGVQYNSGVIPQCIEENTHSNIATNEVIKPGSEVKIGVLRGTEKFDIEAQYWEHDGGNSCSFEREAGDAGWSRGRQLYGPGSTSSVWVQRKFDLNNYANNNEKSGASIKIQKAFRYHYGDSLQRPLDFGLIALGQTKSHTNSTKELGHWTDNGLDIAPDPTLSYQNRYGTSGIDVFYQFQVPSKGAKVSISASSLQAALTGFNLGLFNAQGTRLRFVSSSSIDMNLCPGIYTVLVEGVNNQRGKFQISIAATTLAAGNAGSLSAVDTRVCPGSALPYITGTSATLGGDFDPTNINYEWTYIIGIMEYQTDQTDQDFDGSQLTMPNQNIILRRYAKYCDTRVNAVSLTLRPEMSTIDPGVISLWVDDQVAQQETSLFTAPAGSDPGSFRSYKSVQGGNYDGVGDPPYDPNVPYSVNYTWQDSIPGVFWNNLNPSQCFDNCKSFDPGVINETRYFRRLAENGCHAIALSNVVEIRVLGSNGSIEGKITAGKVSGGAPVGGVTVTIERDNNGVPGGSQTTSTYTTVTNDDGFYRKSQIYFGDNSANFTVTPTFTDASNIVHEFSPSTRTVTLSNSNPGATAINFYDTTSYTISGNVFQQFKNFNCGLDSVVISVSGGKTVLCNLQGDYEVSIPTIGQYTITPSYHGHAFSPSQATIFVDQDVEQNFQDLQMYNLSGVFANGCGDVIGEAMIIINSIDQCITDTAMTLNGFYQIELPANQYYLTFKALEGGIYRPDSVDLYLNNSKTVDLRAGDEVTNFIYRPDLIMQIGGLPAESCLGYPVLEQLQSYIIDIDVFEGNGCLLDTGRVIITDHIGDKGNLQQEIPISKGKARYRLTAGNPNLLSATGFLKNLNIVALDLSAESSISLDTMAIVVGARARPSTFTTVSPQIPLFILRDPPGSGSKSFLSNSETLTTVNRFYTRESSENNIWKKVYAGVKFEGGVGVNIETEITADLQVGATLTQSNLNTSEILTSLQFTEEFSTSDDPYRFGEDADVFIGAAMNLIYAAADVIEFDEKNCRIVEDVRLIIAPNGFADSTEYRYTKEHILTSIIPSLQNQANHHPNPDSVRYFENQVRNWEQIIQMNEDLKERARREGSYQSNISFSGGLEYQSSTTSTTSGTTSIEFSMEIDSTLAYEVGLRVGGVGYGEGRNIDFRMETGGSQETTITNELTTGYILSEDQYTDAFNLDIYIDPVFQTPVFDLVGGESSCPYEEGTVPVDVPGIVIHNPIRTGVSPGTSVPFTFDLYHLGEGTDTDGETRTYRFELNGGSNPDGMILEGGGTNLSVDYPISKSSPQQVTLALQKLSSSDIYTYEGIEFYLYPACYGEAIYADAYGQLASAKVSIYFDNPCSEIRIFEPGDQWVRTSSDGNNLAIHLKDYDKQNLNQVDVEYRSVSQNSWITGLVLNAADLNTNDPGGSNLGTVVQLPIQNLADGEYEIRAKLNCTGASIYSNRVRGLIDRTGPSVFGVPTPLDGTFDSTDVDLQVAFTEDLDCGQIQAVLTNVTTGATVPVSATCHDNALILVPDMDLNAADPAVYQVTISRIKDQYGNLGDTVRWSFTVGEIPPLPHVWYVNASASPGGDGYTWATAFTDLQHALNKAKTDHQIWIAEGIYYPSLDTNGMTSTTSRTVRFGFERDVQLIGGFPNSGDPGMEDRDVLAYPTILSGDIQKNGDPSDNVNSVMVVDGRSKLSMIDGLTLEGGYADGSALYEGGRGAGIYIRFTDFSVRNCVLRNNTAKRGGAISVAGQSKLVIYNSLFYRNYAGGDLDSFQDNYGGAIFIGNSEAQIHNCTFYKNFGRYGTNSGSGRYNAHHIMSLSGTTNVFNCIFYNGLNQGGDEIQFLNNPVVLSNNLFTDPQFVDTTNFDLRPGPCSPALDAGDGSKWIFDYPYDIAGNNRTAGTIDIGAFENAGAFEFNANPLASQIYLSNSSISSRGRVASDGNVTFQAPQYISLLPQFSVDKGGIFLIKIGGCDN